MTARRARSLLTVLALTGSMAALGSPATGDSIRTETELGGFSVAVDAAPFKVLVDDPSIPIPRPEDSAIAEANPSYTAAYLDTGPNARALGSTLWPGNLLGSGLAQVAAGAPAYPVKAEARYPDRPYTATAQDGGALMNASAMGLDALGSARSVPRDLPGVVEIGTITSTSHATVDAKHTAIGTSVSKLTDVDLAAGVIHIGSVSTTLRTTSDGTKPLSTGSTVVSGLRVGPLELSVDDTGVHLAGTTAALPKVAADQLKALGVTIEGVTQTSTRSGDTVSRVAQGLRITLDTGPLRKLVDPTLQPVSDLLGGVIDNLPPAYQGYLFYALAATPKITFILGAGSSSAAAVLPFRLPPFPALPGIVPPGLPGTGVTPGSPGAVGTPVLPGVTPPGTVPQVGGPGATPPVLASRPTSGTGSDPFHGVPARVLLGAAVLAGFGGWGLLRVQGSAFAGGLLGGGCALGAPSDLPNLRGA
jgi:hypothetical protein